MNELESIFQSAAAQVAAAFLKSAVDKADESQRAALEAAALTIVTSAIGKIDAGSWDVERVVESAVVKIATSLVEEQKEAIESRVRLALDRALNDAAIGRAVEKVANEAIAKVIAEMRYRAPR